MKRRVAIVASIMMVLGFFVSVSPASAALGCSTWSLGTAAHAKCKYPPGSVQVWVYCVNTNNDYYRHGPWKNAGSGQASSAICNASKGDVLQNYGMTVRFW
jgi:hypothetical protein